MEVKDIIKNRRLELGLTLDDVARHVGVSAATISRWETGDIKNMRRDRIASLSKVLKLSPSVIMGWDDISMQVSEISVKMHKATDRDEKDKLLNERIELQTRMKEKELIEERDEIEQLRDQLHKRPELKTLFSLTKNATKEDIEKTVKIIEMFKRDHDGDEY